MASQPKNKIKGETMAKAKAKNVKAKKAAKAPAIRWTDAELQSIDRSRGDVRDSVVYLESTDDAGHIIYITIYKRDEGKFEAWNQYDCGSVIRKNPLDASRDAEQLGWDAYNTYHAARDELWRGLRDAKSQAGADRVARKAFKHPCIEWEIIDSELAEHGWSVDSWDKK